MATYRRPQPAPVEALDETGLESIRANFDALFQESLFGTSQFSDDLIAFLTTLATAGYVKTTALGVVSVQTIAIPVTDGGTGLLTYTIGDILYASAATTLSKLSDIATGNALISGGVGAAPSWGKIGLTTHVSGILPEVNGGTNQSTYTTGDLLYASAANTLTKLADVAAGSYLRSGGVATAPVWSTITIPNAATIGDIWYASATSVISALATSASATRYLSNTGASNIPAWAQIALATGVSGVLPIANGGTNATSLTTTRVPYFDGTRLVDDADLTFATDTLTATKLVAPTSISTPSIITASGALGITPAAGSNLNVTLSTTGDFAVNTNQLYVDTSTGVLGVGVTASADNYGNRSMITIGTGAASDNYCAFEFQRDAVTDADGTPIAFYSFASLAQTSSSSGLKRVAIIEGIVEGTTAHNRGGRLAFLTKADGGNEFTRMTITASGNVGIGTVTLATSALLDLTSTTGALLVPRMTTTQKNALTAVNGMIVYDTTLAKFQGYEAGAWAAFSIL